MSAPAASSDAPASAGGRVALAVCAGLIGWALGYTLPIYARLPRFFYDPIARHWFWGQARTPIPLGYVGQLGWALVCALVAGGVTWLLARKPSARAYALGAAWALTALVIVGAYFTWNNWP